jgi:hypothetical protein
MIKMHERFIAAEYRRWGPNEPEQMDEVRENLTTDPDS